jgi:hypothetical protein
MTPSWLDFWLRLLTLGRLLRGGSGLSELSTAASRRRRPAIMSRWFTFNAVTSGAAEAPVSIPDCAPVTDAFRS